MREIEAYLSMGIGADSLVLGVTKASLYFLLVSKIRTSL